MNVKLYLKWVAFAVAQLLWAGSLTLADYGPLQTTNRFPLYLMFINPKPVKAELPAPGGLEVALAVEYSNTHFDHSNSRWNLLMDMEMAVLDIAVNYGITPNLALRLDLPVVSMNSGVLDGFLSNYHNFIGVDNYGRDDRPGDTFGYQVSKDGALWVKGRSGPYQLADPTVSVQFALTSATGEQEMASSLLFSVKTPVGDETRGFSSGAFDVGIYWPTQWPGKRWSYYLMPAVAFIGDPETSGADVSTRNSYGLFGGVAYDYSERLALLAQLIYYSSPVEPTGLSELDDGTLGLDLGFHYQVKPGWIVEFAFCEDLTLAAPDFNLRLGMRWTLSTRSIMER